MSLHKPSTFQVARCHWVVALKDTVTSFYSETLVPAKILNEPNVEPWVAVGLSLTTTLQLGVMVGKPPVDAQHNCIPVRMVNFYNVPREILSAIEVATCEPVKSIVNPNIDPHQEPPATEHGLPEHFKDLYLQSTTGLTDNQQHQLHDHLLEFQYNIFSGGHRDLGCTAAAKHKINPGNTFLLVNILLQSALGSFQSCQSFENNKERLVFFAKDRHHAQCFVWFDLVLDSKP